MAKSGHPVADGLGHASGPGQASISMPLCEEALKTPDLTFFGFVLTSSGEDSSNSGYVFLQPQRQQAPAQGLCHTRLAVDPTDGSLSEMMSAHPLSWSLCQRNLHNSECWAGGSCGRW